MQSLAVQLCKKMLPTQRCPLLQFPSNIACSFKVQTGEMALRPKVAHARIKSHMSVMLLSQQFSLGAYGGYYTLPPLITLAITARMLVYSDHIMVRTLLHSEAL